MLGIEPDDQLKEDFQKVERGKLKVVVGLIKGAEASEEKSYGGKNFKYEQFLEDYKEIKEPRFIWAEFKYTTDKPCFDIVGILYMPPEAPVNSKPVYASSFKAINGKLGGSIKKELQVDSWEGLGFDKIVERLKA